jgi:hypothetical protein
MLDIFDEYATDANAEINGTEFPLGDATLLIARSGNRKFSKLITQLSERHRIALAVKGEASEALDKKLMVEAIADTILLGWTGLGYKGTLLPYTRANAMMVLEHDDFRASVMKMASEMDAYKVKQETEAGKP